MMELQIVLKIYFGFIPVFWYHVCPKVFCPRFLEKCLKVVYPKLFFRNFSARKC